SALRYPPETFPPDNPEISSDTADSSRLLRVHLRYATATIPGDCRTALPDGYPYLSPSGETPEMSYNDCAGRHDGAVFPTRPHGVLRDIFRPAILALLRKA